MGYTCANFHRIPTTLLVDAYYGALHVSLQDCVFIHFLINERAKHIVVVSIKVDHKKNLDLLCPTYPEQ